MTHEEIIELARQVRDGGHWNQMDLIRFAELIIAHAANSVWTQAHWTAYEEQIAAAERKACIADVRRSRLSLDGVHGVSHETSYIADRVLDNAIKKIKKRAAK